MSSLSYFEQTEIKKAVDLINEGAGYSFFSYSGNKPVVVRSVNLSGVDHGYSKPQTLVCEIYLDSNSDLIRATPELLQYAFIHELGHCFGLPYSSNPQDVMYPTFNGNWDNDVVNKLKEFGRRLSTL